MFKFSKIVVLFMVVVSLIGCSSVPSGVDKDFFNLNKKLILTIDNCFNDKNNCNLEEELDRFNKLNDNYPEKDLSVSEVEIRDVVYAALYSYLGRNEIEFKEYFNSASELLNLKKKYVIE